MKDDEEVYLYQSGSHPIEVVLTGRTANRKRGRRIIKLHEITAADKDVEFRAWIKLEQLFTIEE